MFLFKEEWGTEGGMEDDGDGDHFTREYTAETADQVLCTTQCCHDSLQLVPIGELPDCPRRRAPVSRRGLASHGAWTPPSIPHSSLKTWRASRAAGSIYFAPSVALTVSLVVG